MIMRVSPAGATAPGPAMEPGKRAMAFVYRRKRFQASHCGIAGFATFAAGEQRLSSH
jgi:hypothetical protein